MSNSRWTQRLLARSTRAMAVPVLVAGISISAHALPVVTVDGASSFTRTTSWTIDKSASVDALTLRAGESAPVDFEVGVRKSVTDSAWAIAGNILISEASSPFDLVVAFVDAIPTTSSVVCVTPISCTYTASYGDATPGAVRVTLTEATPEKQLLASLDRYFSFTAPTTLVGEQSISIFDDLAGALGVASNDSKFVYSMTLGPYAAPGTYSITNTAAIMETGQKASATVRVTVVPEPATLALIGLGLAGIGALRRRA